MSQPSNLFPLSYLGVRAQRPPNIIVKNFDPEPTFSQNVDLGDFWINFNPQTPTLATIWVLLGLAGGVANWVPLQSGTGFGILTLTGNTGGAVPGLAANINVIGDGTTINVAGNPLTNTLTISAISSGGSGISQIAGNDGIPQSPLAGVFNIVTANSTPKFLGSAATETLDFGLSSLLLGSPGTFIAGALRNVGVGFAALASLSTANDNTAVGFGTLTALSGPDNGNTAVGSLALTALATGVSNTAVGDDALTTNNNGSFNTAVGANALALYAGNNATAVGFNALANDSSGTFNTAVGTRAAEAITIGDNNTALGYEALQDATTTNNNTAVGTFSLNSTTGSDNTAMGVSSLGTVLTGSGNIAIGFEAGINYVADESANILIGNSGVAAEDFAIRIGTQGTQTTAYMAGITGVSVASPQTVVIDSVTGQLGVGSGGGSSILTIEGDSGGALSPTAGNFIFTGGTTGLTFAGTVAPATETLTGVLNAANGGTGSNSASYILDGVFYWDGTKFVTTPAGNAGEFLMSNGGAGLAPSFAPIPGGGGTLIVTQFDFTGASQTWNKNANAKSVLALIWNGGNGGGSGRQGVDAAAGGGGGGSGGDALYWYGPASAWGASETVIVGAGGLGGATQVAANSNGNAGALGGISSIGIMTPRRSLTGVGPGGVPGVSGVGTTTPANIMSFGILNDAGANSSGGQGNSISGSTAADQSTFDMNAFLPRGGGGGGGGRTAAASQGGNGGSQQSANLTVVVTGGTGGIATGIINGTNGANAPTTGGFYFGGAGGGAGGGQQLGLTAGNGGVGGIPGGGGGAGGGSINGTSSGAGGNGGNGRVIIIEYT